MEILLGERLSELIDEKKLTCKELSELSGVSLSSIYGWIKGIYNLSLSNLLKVCDVLKCSIEFLIGRTDKILDFALKTCPPFYERLRAVMQEKGKTRYGMGKEKIVPDNYFTDWKKGADPQLFTLIKLADYLDCTIDHLVGRED